MVEVSPIMPSSTRILINPVISIPNRHQHHQATPIFHALAPPLRQMASSAVLQQPNVATAPINLTASPPSNVLLLIKPQQQPAPIAAPTISPITPQQNPPALVEPATVLLEPPCNPLDLSCKNKDLSGVNPEQRLDVRKPNPDLLDVKKQDPFSIRRANSCSGSILDNDRRLKRKEQNKVAAQSYRQRKKSFSGLIETEHEKLTKRNLQLKLHKQKLEDQIARVRALLNEVIENSKKAEEANEAMSDTASEPPPVQSPSWSMDGNEDFQMRSRKYTWPMALNGKERKKEQNKLASRRFRQRRKQEMSNCELEAQQLESVNKRLKERCDELESKVKLLKDLMNKTNAMMNNPSKTAAIANVATAVTIPPPSAVVVHPAVHNADDAMTCKNLQEQ